MATVLVGSGAPSTALPSDIEGCSNVITPHNVVGPLDGTENTSEGIENAYRKPSAKSASHVNISLLMSRLKCFFGQHLGSQYAGWRFGALSFAIVSLIVLMINLSATAWAFSKSRNNRPLYDGKCDTTKRLNSGTHALINLVSTILLSGSNYCMQCLSSPTRDDVNKAHGRGVHLDIGVPSLHNLRHITRRRLVLWLLHGVSSVPLHLFYNATIFESLPSFQYNVTHVSSALVEDSSGRPLHSNVATLLGLWDNKTTFTRLSSQECIHEYSTTIQSKYTNVLLVSNRSNESSVYWTSNSFSSDRWPNRDWVCSENKNDGCKGRVNASDWHVGSSKALLIDHCLSKDAPRVCRVEFQPVLGIIVVLLNLAKVALMLYTAIFIKEEPLMNLGDAVESFLKAPDIMTEDIRSRRWYDHRFKWKDAPSRWHRYCVFTLLFITWVVLLGLSVWGGRGRRQSERRSSTPSFGAIDPATTISDPNLESAVIGSLVVANCPQLILSLLYFQYNALFTTMLLGYEWVGYSYKKAGLRVSHSPKGEQRDSYFLQLPYRFSIPLIGLSGVLHWLVSQTIFFVSVDFYNAIEENEGRPLRTLGYSPLPITSVVVCVSFMMMFIIVFGHIPYRKGMPLAGSNSLAISAACHPPDGQHAEEKVMWGVVTMASREVPGHCSFSSTLDPSDNAKPEEGMEYA